MKTSTQVLENLSAMADGELGNDECAIALQACRQDEVVLASWNNYHLIGDALRSSAPVMRSMDAAFLARLNQLLAFEPSFGASAVAAGQVRDTANPASNDANFRWKLVAGFASLMAVLAVGWNASGLVTLATGPQIAQGPAAVQQVVVASSQGPMVRNARLEELLAAHKQLGGSSALQVPSGFLRNATFETLPNAGR
ncbi:MAG: sigma-E factor negative regulatory protein [Polaromonas sp.]|nr:sigma-E factor negative regulatory protein [Polaromonas sp.]